MTPQIMKSILGDRYYIVTRYKQKVAPNGTPYNVAQTKYDCTDQVKALMAGMVSLEDDERKAIEYAIDTIKRSCEEYDIPPCFRCNNAVVTLRNLLSRLQPTEEVTP